MKAMNALFVNWFASYDTVASQTTVAKLKRKRWRQNERSPVILFAFYALLTLNSSTVLAHSNDKNWKTDGNSLSKVGGKSLQNVSADEKENGGTKWATATEEASDERRDAEIFQAVVDSIAQWEERRRLRQAKKKQNAHRPKRSQPEKLDKIEDDEEKEPSKVCYSELGCFQEAGYIDLLPNSPDEVNTRYLLYNSRKSRGDTPLFDVSAQNISSLWEWVGKAFNVSAPTKVIVHGFGSSCSNVWVYEMRSALMSVEDCNIICVDWEAGATIPNYVRAAANTRLVGKQVAILLSGLEKFVNLSVRNVHVIGFSLGAHVAGFAGSELKNLSRITGLDPAGPLFESQDRRARLDSMDAHFVDVIHSNGENLILGGLGAWQPMGHVDFYPNGGRMQKGCTNLFVGAVSDMIWSANEVYGRSLCNHRRAYKFFTDSVSPKCQFPAVPCESYDHFIEGKCFPCENLKDCSNMGFHSNKFAGRGTLYLLTRDEEPFCANQYMVKVENTPDKDLEDESTRSTTFGKLQITLIGDLELNETFVITQKKDEKLVSGESVSRIIVPHPALQNFLKMQVQYVAYKGWLSSGQNKWRINKISLTNSYGQVLSACDDLTLESGVPVMLDLIPKDCSGNEDIINFNRTTKSPDLEMNHLKFPNDLHRNHSTFNVFPHTQVVRIGNEILSTKDSVPPAKLNRSSTWINASIVVKDVPHELTTRDNVTRIGIGVTEYINDPWKQKAEFPEPPSVHVLNDLEGNDDIGEGRRLVIKSARKVNVSAANETTATSVTAQPSTGKPPVEKHTPYEFVTEKPNLESSSKAVVDSSSESKITEPVLKPKPSTAPRTRKSQNVHRPNYGKSINVQNDWVASSTDAATGKKSNALAVVPNTSSNNESVSNARIGTESVSSEAADSSSARADSGSTKKGSDAKNITAQSFVVQFLPQKLVSFFEQAEKYARMAFSPFISTQDSSRSNPERARRIRAFGSNRWISGQGTKNKNERLDMDSEESRIMASVVPSPSIRITASSFPYAYQVHQQHLWQHISQLSDHDYKYIPLVSQEDSVSSKEALKSVPQAPINSR